MIKLKTKEWSRQGDVGIIAIESLPEGLKKVQRGNDDRYTVARGESTGHAHVIRDRQVTVWQNEAGTLFIEAPQGFTLEHLIGDAPTGEHAPHELAPGNYQFAQQHELVGDEWQQAMD